MFWVSDYLVSWYGEVSVGWREIPKAAHRHEAASSIFTHVDSISFLYLGFLSCEPQDTEFPAYRNLLVQLENIALEFLGDQCYSFSTGTVCVPSTLYTHIPSNNR